MDLYRKAELDKLSWLHDSDRDVLLSACFMKSPWLTNILYPPTPGLPPPRQPWSNLLLSFPLLIRPPAAPPFFNGGPGYYTRKNF